ncbi:complement resistance protein TraT [Magnetospirillum gryphiswaldense]|uniref:complement resistance protein TraT n=1 Tax=Magnetospirillum gryphiswaldense TaxID=55518 RepID=UPI000D221B66|nr:complement resistance protein TraT [Magnetospirillum gryphiswaldense]AVM73237.1 Enterobacterial TraT complement resistance protein [Magnetospirillum gryphiswaldense MSR-1]AVM77140.1 Enterobacterial TraT complement resistance protein [Magnetospirillum gryphiswaldense]
MLLDRRLFIAGGTAALLGACQRRNVSDMVVDAKTDRMYGMRSDGTVFTDPALHPNRRLKVSLRNMSGDPVWDLEDTREQLYQGYTAKGYERSDGNDFGLKIDLNVIRSQQYDRDMMAQYGFLGAATGPVAGAVGGALIGGTPSAAAVGAGAGMATGVSLGTLAGYFTVDNIYVVITEAIFAIRRNATKPRRVVTFDGSPRVEEWEGSGTGSFSQVHRVTIANYGGGRNITQQEIAEDIRKRQMRSLISLV